MTGLRHSWALAALLALPLTLSACSPKTEDQPAAPPAPSEVRTPAVPASAPAPAPTEGATVGGDGSQIQLTGLTLADQQANPVEGELGCSFRTDAADPLLTASGFSDSKDPAHGLVKVTGYVERIAAPKGFDGIAKGATFVGAGKTVIIAVTGEATGGGESPPNPATLTYQRADGASRVFVGTWTCGP